MKKMKSETIYQIILSVLAGEATEQEQQTLLAWIGQSKANKHEFEKMKRLYQVSASKRKDKPAAYDVDQAWERVNRRTIGKKRDFTLKRWLPYAALVAILLSVGGYFIQKQVPSDFQAKVNVEDIKEPTLLLENGERIPLSQENFAIQRENTLIRNNSEKLTYETESKDVENGSQSPLNHLVIPKGSAYELKLADGTHVWLNAQSELTYPTRFSGCERRVKLKGEAYFDVTKDPDKPFFVETNGAEVKVLGTSFNVAGYEDESESSVTLIEGSVCVHVGDGEHFQISPDEQLTWDRQTRKTQKQTVDTRLFTSWIQGEYVFKDATLEDIFRKLHRWYDFSVTYDNEQLKQKRFSLAVDRKISLDQLLEIISYTSNVKLKRMENGIHVKQEEKEEI